MSLDIRSRRAEGWNIFEHGARDALLSFDIFEVAIAEQWGGSRSREKFDKIVDDLLMNCKEQWDLSNDLHVDTLDVYLIECLESDFNINFDEETDSDRVVTVCSLAIQDLYRKCASFNFEEARTLIDGLREVARRRNGGAPRPRIESISDDEDNEEDNDEDVVRQQRDESMVVESNTRRSGEASGTSERARVIDSDGWETIPVRKGGRGGGGGGGGGSGSSGGNGGGGINNGKSDGRMEDETEPR